MPSTIFPAPGSSTSTQYLTNFAGFDSSPVQGGTYKNLLTYTEDLSKSVWTKANVSIIPVATQTLSSNGTTGTNFLTVASVANIGINQPVSGTGVNVGTYVSGINSTTVYLSKNFTSTGSGTYNFYNAFGNNTVLSNSVTQALSQTVTVSSSTQYTFSFYAKIGNATAATYGVYDNTNSSNIVAPTSYYNSINVAVTTTATGTSGIPYVVVGNAFGIYVGMAITAATGVTLGTTVIGVTPSTANIALSANNSGTVSGSIRFADLRWQRITSTFTTAANTTSINVYPLWTISSGFGTTLISAPQLETGASATAYQPNFNISPAALGLTTAPSRSVSIVNNLQKRIEVIKNPTPRDDLSLDPVTISKFKTTINAIPGADFKFDVQSLKAAVQSLRAIPGADFKFDVQSLKAAVQSLKAIPGADFKFDPVTISKFKTTINAIPGADFKFDVQSLKSAVQSLRAIPGADYKFDVQTLRKPIQVMRGIPGADYKFDVQTLRKPIQVMRAIPGADYKFDTNNIFKFKTTINAIPGSDYKFDVQTLRKPIQVMRGIPGADYKFDVQTLQKRLEVIKNPTARDNIVYSPIKLSNIDTNYWTSPFNTNKVIVGQYNARLLNYTIPTTKVVSGSNTILTFNSPSSAIYGITNAPTYYTTFNGTTQYLVTPTSATAFAFGTGDFTIEFWLYQNSGSLAARQDYVDFGGVGILIWWNGINALEYFVNGSRIVGVNAITVNVWYHIAVVRYAGNTRLFVNGSQVGITYADTNSFSGSSQAYIGRNLASAVGFVNGYISNLRIVKGIAVYNGPFIPNGPLARTQPARFNVNSLGGNETSLLALQSSSVTVDNSINNFTLTNVGTIGAPTQSVGLGTVPYQNDYLLITDNTTNNQTVAQISTVTYTAPGSVSSINVPYGQALYTSSTSGGTYNPTNNAYTFTWTAPANVYTVSTAVIGGGGGGSNGGTIASATGGGGGALAYKNSISVIPLQTYTVQVGSGGTGVLLPGSVNTGGAGGASYFKDTNTVYASGGSGGGYLQSVTVSLGQALYDSSTSGGSYDYASNTYSFSWQAPANVYYVSVVAVGGGGAGGSGLGLTLGTIQAGGTSYFSSTSIVFGGGGTNSMNSFPAAGGGGSFFGDGGGTGGNVAAGRSVAGGGAGGYNGYGGQGAIYTTIVAGNPPQAGSGGGQGGGNSSTGSGIWAAGGGGVGVYGIGADGSGGTSYFGAGGGSGGSNGGTATAYSPGSPGGSYGGGGGAYSSLNGGAGGGLGWKNHIPVVPGNYYTVVVGGGGLSTYGSGASGAVRIIWPSKKYGDNTVVRAFGATVGTTILATDQSSSIIDTNAVIPSRSAGGTTYIGDGGGLGGAGGAFILGSTLGQFSSGGGGAGGYNGAGGAGGDAIGSGATGNAATAGTTGGGGGGATGGGTISSSAGAGGGVSVVPTSISNGTAGNVATAGAVPTGGDGGSSGAAGGNGSTSNSTVISTGGVYGGGGAGIVNTTTGSIGSGAGASGAVRIMWPANKISDGTTVRAYSSTTGGLTLVSDQSGTLSDSLPSFQYVLTIPTASLSNLNINNNWTVQLWDPEIFPQSNLVTNTSPKTARDNLYYVNLAPGRYGVPFPLKPISGIPGADYKFDAQTYTNTYYVSPTSYSSTVASLSTNNPRYYQQITTLTLISPTNPRENLYYANLVPGRYGRRFPFEIPAGFTDNTTIGKTSLKNLPFQNQVFFNTPSYRIEKFKIPSTNISVFDSRSTLASLQKQIQQIKSTVEIPVDNKLSAIDSAYWRYLPVPNVINVGQVNPEYALDFVNSVTYTTPAVIYGPGVDAGTTVIPFYDSPNINGIQIGMLLQSGYNVGWAYGPALTYVVSLGSDATGLTVTISQPTTSFIPFSTTIYFVPKTQYGTTSSISTSGNTLTIRFPKPSSFNYIPDKGYLLLTDTVTKVKAIAPIESASVPPVGAFTITSGQALYTSSTAGGTYYPADNAYQFLWQAPTNVYRVSVVAVGGGGGGANAGSYPGLGGGGGALAYTNNISVVPGQQYLVQVGAGGTSVLTPGSAESGSAGGASYFKDSSTVYASGGAGGLYNSGLFAVQMGEALLTGNGTSSGTGLSSITQAADLNWTAQWTAPPNVYSVSVVCIGGGGGGGGANRYSYVGFTWTNAAGGGAGGGLAWSANVPVVPGQTYTIQAGRGGLGGSPAGVNIATAGEAGGDSYFKDASTVIAYGGGGGDAANSPLGGGSAGGSGGGYGGIYTSGGGSGGNASEGQSSGGNTSPSYFFAMGAGGGAGGYGGNGGNGRRLTILYTPSNNGRDGGTAGSGGGGGGGGGSVGNKGFGPNNANYAASGGGTGLYGQGPNGALGNYNAPTYEGGGGSYGTSGSYWFTGGTTSGTYGGGAWGGFGTVPGGTGGIGAIRIIWPAVKKVDGSTIRTYGGGYGGGLIDNQTATILDSTTSINYSATSGGSTYVGIGGGAGGPSGGLYYSNTYGQFASGGGGAGGYSGAGGSGGDAIGIGASGSAATNSTGGGGGGGGATVSGSVTASSAGGGGVGVLGSGSNGTAGNVATAGSVPTGGGGGSNGTAGGNGSSSTSTVVSLGGVYGGGGGAILNSSTGSTGAGAGASGAVRIIWPSNKIFDNSIVRAFPSTLTTDSFNLVDDDTGATLSYVIDTSTSYLSNLNPSNSWTVEVWDPEVFPQANVITNTRPLTPRENLYYSTQIPNLYGVRNVLTVNPVNSFDNIISLSGKLQVPTARVAAMDANASLTLTKKIERIKYVRTSLALVIVNSSFGKLVKLEQKRGIADPNFRKTEPIQFWN